MGGGGVGSQLCLLGGEGMVSQKQKKMLANIKRALGSVLGSVLGWAIYLDFVLLCMLG